MSVRALPAAMMIAAIALGEASLGATTALAAPLLVAPVAAAPAATTVSFWGRPYPYGYAYRRPRDECRVLHRVRGPHGWHWRRVWICGSGVVTSRY